MPFSRRSLLRTMGLAPLVMSGLCDPPAEKAAEAAAATEYPVAYAHTARLAVYPMPTPPEGCAWYLIANTEATPSKLTGSVYPYWSMADDDRPCAISMEIGATAFEFQRPPSDTNATLDGCPVILLTERLRATLWDAPYFPEYPEWVAYDLLDLDDPSVPRVGLPCGHCGRPAGSQCDQCVAFDDGCGGMWPALGKGGAGVPLEWAEAMTPAQLDAMLGAMGYSRFAQEYAAGFDLPSPPIEPERPSSGTDLRRAQEQGKMIVNRIFNDKGGRY